MVPEPERMELDANTQAIIGYNPFVTYKHPKTPQRSGFNPFARNQNPMMEVDQITSTNNLPEPERMEVDVEDPVAIFLRPSKIFKTVPSPPIVYKQKVVESKNSGVEDELAIFFGDNKFVKTGFPAFGFFKPQQQESNLSIRSKYPAKKRRWSEVEHEDNDDVIESVSKRRCSNVDHPSGISGELPFFHGEGNEERSPVKDEFIGKDCDIKELNNFNQNIHSYEHHLANRQRM